MKHRPFQESPDRTRNLPTRIRTANACVAGAVLIALIAHEALGAFAGLRVLPSDFRGLIWVIVALAAGHGVLSIATSFFMLTDENRPPSAKKRGHLYLKWATGIVVAALASAHAICGGYPHDALTTALAALLAAALAWHGFVGAKSLLKDLRLPRSARNPMRIALCVCTAAIVLAIVLR